MEIIMKKPPKPQEKKYLVEYQIKGKILKKKKWRDLVWDGVVKTNKKFLTKNVFHSANEIIQKYTEDSKLEIKDIQIITGKKTLIKKGKGCYQIKYKEVKNIKIGRQGILNDNEWCKEKGTCCLDYVIYKYKGMNRIKKLLPTDNWDTCMKNLYSFWEIDAENYDGITLDELKRFCKCYDITLLVLDIDDNCLIYEKSKNGHLPAMIIYVANNHIYPVENKKIRDGLVRKYKDKKSNFISDSVSIEKKEKVNKIVVHNDTELDKNIWAFEMIMKNYTLPNNIKTTGSMIESFEIDDNLYITDEKDIDVENYFIRKGITYQGETIQHISADYLRQANIRKSVFNTEVEEIMNLKNVKYRTHFGLVNCFDFEEDMNTLIDNGEFVSIDICKCYTSCLLEIKDWLCFDINDNFEDFDGVLKFGLYFVETEDLSILHQSNIYSNRIIEYALSYGVELKIVKQLIPKKKYKDEEKIDLTKMFETIQHDAGSLSKNILNCISGLFGKTEQKKYYTSMDTDIQVVHNKIGDVDSKDYIFKSFTDGIKTYHLFGYVKKNRLFETWLPMYLQILDLSNIKLHQLSTKIGGEVVFRKTDMVLCKGGVVPELSNVIGGYKIEKKEIWSFPPMVIDRHIHFPNHSNHWNISPLNDSSQRKDILSSIMSNGGGLITGRAGTGKSFCIEEVTNCMKSAYTNIASRHIKGSTIHKTLGIDKNNNITWKIVQSLGKCDCWIIDEASMIPQYLWKHIYFIKKKYPQLVFIILGDYRQLEPVEPNLLEEVDIFNSSVVKYLCNNLMFELNVMKRYDVKLWNYLEEGYERGNWTGLNSRVVSVEELISNKNISYYNHTRCHINNRCMEYCIQHTSHILLNSIVEDNTLLEQKTWIYVGLPVMVIKTSTKLGIINGEKFVIDSYDSSTFTLNDIVFPFDKFAEYFVVNYCSTTHKCQGETYTQLVILWDFYDKMITNKKIAYTACSRSVCFDNLLIGI